MANAKTKIVFMKHGAAQRTISCGSYRIEPGEGVNGPMMLSWWDGADKEGAPTGFASQVTDYEIDPAD